MAKSKSKAAVKAVHAPDGEEPPADENEQTPREGMGEQEMVTEHAEKADTSNTITIDGELRKPGDTFSVQSQQVTLVEERHLNASPRSGVSGGEYPIVSIVMQPGNRIAHRALVGGDLYPIRQYGTPAEVISKVREASGPRKRRKEVPAPQRAQEFEEAILTDEATEILEEYLSLKPDLDRTEVLSDLVAAHLAPEVKRMRAAREAVARLPAELLTLLVNASEEKRRHLMEVLTQ